MNEHDVDLTAESRLTQLEIKMSYLEDFLNQIQEISVLQGKEIEFLRKENRMLAEKMRDIADSMEGDIPNRKPPHY